MVIVRLAAALFAGLLACGWAAPARAQWLPTPELSTAIATGLIAYFNSQEGQCQLHACSCDVCNQGAKDLCHEVARRLDVFRRNPNQYNYTQVDEITRSERAQCLGRALVSAQTWAAFKMRGGPGWQAQPPVPPAPDTPR